MFHAAYSSFSQDWKDNIFFYMCMEDERLWEPVFGRSYKSNEEFESDMIDSYFKKVSK
jgi:spore photoproduct lyase